MIEPINSIKSKINNDNDIKTTSSKCISSWGTKINYILCSHGNKPHNNNWSNLAKNISNKQYSWNQKCNNVFENIFSYRINSENSALEVKNNQKIMNKFEIMKMLDHINILKTIDIIYNDKKDPSILFEECPTDLNHVIQNKMLSKVQLVYSIYQIHLNLKPTNILISEDGTII